MTTMVLQNNVRIGIQIVVEGEKLEIQKVLTLLTLFLECVIPAIATLRDFAGLCIAIVGGIEDTFSTISRIDLAPLAPTKRDFVILRTGIRLVCILIKVMVR